MFDMFATNGCNFLEQSGWSDDVRRMKVVMRRLFATFANLPSLLGAAGLALASCGGSGKPRATPPDAPLSARMATADVDHGRILFRQCAGCHTIGEGAGDRAGPNLYGVFGRDIGSEAGRYSYTAALREKGGAWTAAALDAWLIDPRGFVPGTKMAYAGLRNGNDRADIIAYLAANGPKPIK
jgi:cytochrome c